MSCNTTSQCIKKRSPPVLHCRQEAAAELERKMAAMEACLAARRVIAVPEAPKTAAELMAEQMKAAVQAPPQVGSTGPAAGSGFEILLQVHTEALQHLFYGLL